MLIGKTSREAACLSTPAANKSLIAISPSPPSLQTFPGSSRHRVEKVWMMWSGHGRMFLHFFCFVLFFVNVEKGFCPIVRIPTGMVIWNKRTVCAGFSRRLCLCVVCVSVSLWARHLSQIAISWLNTRRVFHGYANSTPPVTPVAPAAFVRVSLCQLALGKRLTCTCKESIYPSIYLGIFQFEFTHSFPVMWF